MSRRASTALVTDFANKPSPDSLLLVSTLVGLCILMNGCNGKSGDGEKGSAKEATAQQSANDLIAVVDLNVVAMETGQQASIDLSVKRKEQQLKGEIESLKTELQRLEQDWIKDNPQPDPVAKSELEKLQQENRTKLSRRAQAAQSALVAHHSALKQKLLAKIQPIAYQVAREKGMQIVLASAQVYAAGPNGDITADVIKQMKQMSAKNQTAVGEQNPPKTRIAVLPDGGDFIPR